MMVVTVTECNNMVIQANPGGENNEMGNGDADVDEDDIDEGDADEDDADEYDVD